MAPSPTTTTTVSGVPTFQRFFRETGEFDVDKDDLRRYSDFIFENIYDLLLRGQATTRANDRGTMEEWDLPITKGLQECIHRFRQIDVSLVLQPILDHLAARPQLDVLYSDDLQARLPEVAGGLSVALAQAIKIIDPKVSHLHGEQWDRAFQLFDLLL
jgi:hypothetical protein